MDDYECPYPTDYRQRPGPDIPKKDMDWASAPQGGFGARNQTAMVHTMPSSLDEGVYGLIGA